MVMGERGMADMTEMTMPLPDNTLPMLLSNMGWQSKVNLREGLEKTYDWYMKNVAE